jgi:hypothetical protein
MNDGFPAWRYGPNGQSEIFNSAIEVPDGWTDTPPAQADWFDPFQTSDEVSAPSRRTANLTPSDNALLPRATKALYVGTGGTIVLRAVDDDSDTTFANVADGAILDVRVVAIRSNGTTASNIVGFF